MTAFHEAGFIGRDSDFNGVGFTVLRCDTCCALVAEEDRRGHDAWHRRALDGDTTEEQR